MGATVWFGDFYTGTLTQWETSINYSSGGGHLQLRIAAENNFGDLPEGSFIQRLYQLRVTYAFSPDLILSSYTQYDSESRNVGLNNRLRWTLQPGNDLFLVWNRGFLRPPDPDDWSGLQVSEDHIALKLRWTFRM